ncbi:MAG: cysteine--tRNA ligase [Candidatus Pacebacteria bacterium]|nr:cysteine--tRNA ligase [Candidatus Paceibacterota bacterium]
MDIKIYNTLSKNKETFKPLKPGVVGMYHCGPTVYDHAHIGNLRAYVFADTLRRMFEYNSYQVNQVINITDVGHLTSDADAGEDKMTKALIRENMPLTLNAMREVGTKYFDAFVENLKELHIELPQAFPRASDTITEDIELIKQLEKNGFVYQLSDGVYFDTGKFPHYGKLGGQDLIADEADVHARIAQNTDKKNHRDFAVWKLSAKQNVGEESVLIGWDSPWGKGFPGWHIECSAMSRMILGQPFDIHTGGIDHISVHHNNEIAQSEAAYGTSLANYWMHNAFITIKKAKMAKSEGNFLTLDTLELEHISPLAYRYWLLTGHYRSTVNFTGTAVQGAQKALIRLLSIVSGYPDGGTVVSTYKERFWAFINDDLDIPQAVALVWELIKDAKVSPADKRATILDFDRVLGLNIESVPHVELPVADTKDIPLEITVLAEAREDARKTKEWAKADALRTEIQERGFDVIDGESGFSIITR